MSDHDDLMDICNDCFEKFQEEEEQDDEHEFEVEDCPSQCDHGDHYDADNELDHVVMRGFILLEIPLEQKKPPPLCRYYNTPKGCRNGESCKYTHKVVECKNSNCDKKKCIYFHPTQRYFKTKGRAKQRYKPY